MDLPLTGHLKQLRRSGRFDAARSLLATALARRDDSALRHLAWQHEPFWWQPLQGRRVQLTRRGPGDLALVRRCWADRDFMRRFNRSAAALPATDDALHEALQRESAAIPGEARALHWTVNAAGRSWGFVSATEIDLSHRRAELLVGVLPGCSARVSVEASHLALAFLARRAGIERLTAHFYPDNTHAIASARSLGFEVEGVLRGYLREPDGTRTDLVVAGLQLDEGFFQRSARLRQRLLGAGAAG